MIQSDETEFRSTRATDGTVLTDQIPCSVVRAMVREPLRENAQGGVSGDRREAGGRAGHRAGWPPSPRGAHPEARLAASAASLKC